MLCVSIYEIYTLLRNKWERNVSKCIMFSHPPTEKTSTSQRSEDNHITNIIIAHPT